MKNNDSKKLKQFTRRRLIQGSVALAGVGTAILQGRGFANAAYTQANTHLESSNIFTLTLTLQAK